MGTDKLILRILNGRTDHVLDLIKKGSSISERDNDGVTLIQWCAYYGDVSAIKLLLDHGASLTDLGENYDLNGACFHGHWRLVQFLLESGADANHSLPGTGETPLHAAQSHADSLSSGHVTKLLLACDANPNALTVPAMETGSFMRDVRTKGESPLHRAAAFSSYDTISMLLEAGADKTQKDATGETPLSWASWHLRPAGILHLLCYAHHKIHPEQVKKFTSDHGNGSANGMNVNLLGNIVE